MISYIETLNHWGDQFLNFAWPMLWQSSLLIAVIFVLEFALRRKIRAAIRYALWLVVLVKLLLPPSLALPTSPTWWIHPSVPPPAKAPPVSFTVSYGEQMTPNFSLPPPPVTPPPRVPAMSFAAWTLTASVVVSAGLLAWLLVRWRQINQKARRATASEKLIPVLDKTRHLTHLRPGIRLKLTEDSMSPAVCGLFRPVILLPQSLVNKLSAGQLRAVLLHEAIHLRRGDVWVNCAQALLQIVYWWHPLLWLANARIRRVREEAVDDAVMLALRDDAEIYAPTLLEVAKLAFNRPLASLGLVGILESRSALRQRIERLVNFNAPRKAGLTVASILGILAFSAVALPMGEAPEKTNAAAINLESNTNSPIPTNAVNAKIESATLTQDGKTLYEMGKFDDAEAKLKAALALNPDNQAAHYYLSLVAQSRWAPKPQGPIIVYPALDGSRTNSGDVHTSPGREAVYRKLNSLRLESISWSNGLPLSEVIRYFAEQSKLQDPDKKAINFMFNPNVATGAAASASNLINPATGLPETPATNAVPETVDVTAINVKLMLNNASLHEVLDAVVRGADRPIRYTVEDYGVIISAKPPGPEPPMLEMRVFKIDTNTFAAGNLIRHISGGSVTLETNSVPAMAKSFFSAIGVNLTAPGRTVAFNDKLGLLFVKATPSEMDTIERVIQELNQVPPQDHSKVPSIGVPEAGSVMPQLSSNATTGQMTGILSDTNFQARVHALEQRTGVETLSEPKAVTTSGRQTQLRTANRVESADYTPAAHGDASSTRIFIINYPTNENDLNKLLLDAGVKIPPMVLIYDNNGILLVRGTEEQLALVDQVVMKLNGFSPKESNANHFVKQTDTIAGANPVLTNLEMRVFKVDPNTFISGLRNIPDLRTNNVATMAQSLVSKLGVDLTAPGKSIAYNDKLGMLFVKATPSELDTIERIVQALNQINPQIHIKVRFIEVEQDNNEALGFDWYLGSFSNGPAVANGRGAPSPAVPVSAANPLGNATTNVIPASATDRRLTSGLRNTAPVPATITGILTDPNFRVTLHALESRPRTKILAEPEAVTISGRQTQMRATVIQTVLTNINPLALKLPGVSSNDLFLTEQVECGPVFDVVPYVLADGYTINLTTTASVTEFLGYDRATNPATVYIDGKKQTVPVPLPKFRTQKISTVVNLWDNQTLVLGGAVTSAVQITKNKVPLMGDLPLLGGLFRSQTENSVKKQLMVFVTATIVDPAGNRVHSDDELPFNPSTIPVQAPVDHFTPSR